ncbi:MAG TPA: hypothetical protein VIF15_07840 [Polyangiaceae bacterium]
MTSSRACRRLALWAAVLAGCASPVPPPAAPGAPSALPASAAAAVTETRAPVASAAASAVAAPASPAPLRVARLALGTNYSVALLSDGTVMAWGLAQFSSITLDGKAGHPTPVRVPGIDHVAQVGVGEDFACVLGEDRRVTCWGRDWDQWTRGRHSTAAVVHGEHVAELGVAGRHGCALGPGGSVDCWGSTLSGGSAGSATFQRIAVAGDRVCGIKADQTVWCWGLKLGREWEYWPREGYEPYASDLPMRARGLAGVRSLAGSTSHLCAIVEGGEVQCLGFGEHGQLGNGKYGAPYAEIVATKAIGLTDAEELAVGSSFTCARTRDGKVWCWGANGAGQLGLGDAKQRTTPTPVPGLADVVQLAAGDDYACAVRASGEVLCWGGNAYGQLGTGDHLARSVPVPVKGLPPDFREVGG